MTEWQNGRSIAALFTLIACGDADAQLDGTTAQPLQCEMTATSDWPREVRETSGLAIGAAGVFWTHNDRGHDAVLHAVDAAGNLRASVALAGASAEDWEDIEQSSCAAGNCLFIGDIGDNDGVRRTIAIHGVVEPQVHAGTGDVEGRTTGAAATSHDVTTVIAMYPDRPQDAEALFVLDGTLYIVSKGEHGPVMLYRVPTDATGGSSEGDGPASGRTVTLEPVRQLGAVRRRDPAKVTGASASPDGRWVAIRSYATLHLFDAAALVSGQELAPFQFDLTPLGEPQGEGVAIQNDGVVWLSSESERGDAPPRLTRLQCQLPVRP